MKDTGRIFLNRKDALEEAKDFRMNGYRGRVKKLEGGYGSRYGKPTAYIVMTDAYNKK